MTAASVFGPRTPSSTRLAFDVRSTARCRIEFAPTVPTLTADQDLLHDRLVLGPAAAPKFQPVHRCRPLPRDPSDIVGIGVAIAADNVGTVMPAARPCECDCSPDHSKSGRRRILSGLHRTLLARPAPLRRERAARRSATRRRCRTMRRARDREDAGKELNANHEVQESFRLQVFQGRKFWIAGA